jgi:NAD(P)-dependent dehydrogenase (short-subunit alcohol dehydrogenase family)
VPFAKDGIRSTVLLPGATWTPKPTRRQAERELKRKTAAGVPLGRVGTTRDMTDASSSFPTAPPSSPAPT